MKKILVIGATGQIGSALMTKLRKEYGNDNVVAGYIEGVPLSEVEKRRPFGNRRCNQCPTNRSHHRQI